jgi:1-acyl-sn-glycerol-3-phosphate acyltransferase
MLTPGSAPDRAWRVFGTGLSFAVFGIGGVIMSLTIFPLLRATSFDPETTRRRIQRAMQLSFRLFLWFMAKMTVVTHEVHGAEKLEHAGGRLIVANHPSLIDVVLIIAQMPAVDCIVKQALWRNPFLRWPVRWGGYIPNTTPERLIEDCAATLRAGRSLLVFPEGTRTDPGEPMVFKRGAAQVALAAGSDIVPITIHCSTQALTKDDVWWRVPVRAGHWVLRVEDPIPIAPFQEAPPGLAARRLTQHLHDYFTTRVPPLERRFRREAAV